MAKKNKTISIASPEELGVHLTDEHETLKQLQAKVDGLEAQESTRSREALEYKRKMDSALAKANFSSGTIEHGNMDYEGLGKWVKAACHNEHKKLDEIIEKADWGDALTGDSSSGSYLIPEQYITEVLRIAKERSPLFELVNKVKMISNSAKWPKLSSTVSFTFITNEETELTESAPVFTEVDLDVLDFGMVIPVSENFLDDSPINIGRFFTDLVSEAYTTSFEAGWLSSTSNPVGLLHNTSINEHIMSPGSPGFSDLTIKDLWEALEDLDTKAERRNIRWLIHPTIIDIVRRLQDAQGNYVLYRDLERGAPGMLLGFPVSQIDGMPNIGDSAKSTSFILLGNPKEMLWGERLPLEFKPFPNTLYGATYAETLFRGRYRAAFAIGHTGSFSKITTAAS